mmetsp:Transcript_14021/g.12003  ORF Transcript_14021/g.12003 Transcript_14021/m.12003 type:complete len:114 (+) Transcript_14021:58-399(+)
MEKFLEIEKEVLKFIKENKVIASASLAVTTLLLTFASSKTARLYTYHYFGKFRKAIAGKSVEERCIEYITKNAKKGDAKSVVDRIDEFCYKENFMVNLGDQKGIEVDKILQQN